MQINVELNQPNYFISLSKVKRDLHFYFDSNEIHNDYCIDTSLVLVSNNTTEKVPLDKDFNCVTLKDGSTLFYHHSDDRKTVKVRIHG